MYKAKNKETGELFAVKEQDVSEMGDLQFEQLQKEINIMEYLRGYENVVQLHEIDQEGDIVYIVMELLEGGDMWDHSFSDVFKEADVQDFFRSLLGTLEMLHNNGIVHYDIKPDNIAYKVRYLRPLANSVVSTPIHSLHF